jgi:hypothetical protein
LVCLNLGLEGHNALCLNVECLLDACLSVLSSFTCGCQNDGKLLGHAFLLGKFIKCPCFLCQSVSQLLKGRVSGAKRGNDDEF